VLRLDNLGNARVNSFAYGNPFLAGRQSEITPLRPLTAGLTISRSF
jgi:iron complex outermembrane receptor protein